MFVLKKKYMKNVTLMVGYAIILMLQLNLSARGQAKNFESPNKELDQFTGTWKSVNSEKVFQLVLIKKKILLPQSTDKYMNVIEGYYIFDKQKSMDKAVSAGVIYFDNNGEKRNNILKFLIYDKSLDWGGKGYLKIDLNSTSNADLIIDPNSGKFGKKGISFAFPRELKLIKIK